MLENLKRLFALPKDAKRKWDYEDPRGEGYDFVIGAERTDPKYVAGATGYSFWVLTAFLLAVAGIYFWKTKKK